jgi:hypothetical protein
MLKRSFFVLGAAAVLATTSCGIFKKDCGCPKFGKVKVQPKAMPVVYAVR